MIDQYKLDSLTNSIRDTGKQLVEVSTSQFRQFIKSSCFDNLRTTLQCFAVNSPAVRLI